MRVLLLSALLVAVNAGGAESGVGPTAATQFALRSASIDGGGTSYSQGGTFALAGTIAQPEAATELAAGTLALRPGFWVQSLVPSDGLFSDSFE